MAAGKRQAREGRAGFRGPAASDTGRNGSQPVKALAPGRADSHEPQTASETPGSGRRAKGAYRRRDSAAGGSAHRLRDGDVPELFAYAHSRAGGAAVEKAMTLRYNGERIHDRAGGGGDADSP